MSNLPLGAEHDPRAPWNTTDFDIKLEDISSAVRGDIAPSISSLIWDNIKEYTSDDQLAEAIYDDIYEDAKTIFEHEIY